MFGFIKEKASGLAAVVAESAIATKDAASEKAGAIKQSVVGSASQAGSTASGYFDQYWPTVERVLVDGLLDVAHDRLKDDEAYLSVVNTLFELLPTPIRLVLPRAALERHSLKHRDTIVQKIESRKAELKSACSTPTLEPQPTS